MSVGLAPSRAAALAVPVQSQARLVVGIGELAIGRAPGGTIITHALGSCIAVCVWDPATRTGGLLHILLSESKINPARAAEQPGAFADTGVPLLLRGFAEAGIDPKRCLVKLAGGAEVTGLAGAGSLNVGKRNLLAARQWLWKAGVLVKAEATGGHVPRTAVLHLDTGGVAIRSGQAPAIEI